MTAINTGLKPMRDPNIQNIPIHTDEAKAIKEAFIKDSMFKIDFADAERRILAELGEGKEADDFIAEMKFDPLSYAVERARELGIGDIVNSRQLEMYAAGMYAAQSRMTPRLARMGSVTKIAEGAKKKKKFKGSKAAKKAARRHR